MDYCPINCKNNLKIENPILPKVSIVKNFIDTENHRWCNQYKYGNIALSTNDNFTVLKEIKPWNRLERLSSPYFTNVDTNMAWVPK